MNFLYVISTLFFVIVLNIESNGQDVFKKNLIQVGRSGFYFGDQNFKIGKSEIGTTNHSPWLYSYIPYLTYERRQFKNFGLRVSIEEYDVSYCKDCPRPEPMEVTNRLFYLFQIGIISHISIFRKVELSSSLQFSKRFNGREYGIEKYINQGWWEEAVAFSNKINATGGAMALEISYSPINRLSFHLKGEYIKFNNYPKNQVGMSASFGYAF